MLQTNKGYSNVHGNQVYSSIMKRTAKEKQTYKHQENLNIYDLCQLYHTV